MEELKPCPRCGTKAYLSRDVVDGSYFGWSAGVRDTATTMEYMEQQ